MIFETNENFIIERASWGGDMPSMHYHSTYEVYYLEAGNRKYFVENKFFPVSAGSFVLVSPYRLHRTVGDFGTRTLIGFSEEFMLKTFSKEATEKILKCFERVLITPSDEKKDMIISKLNALHHINDENLMAIKLASLLCDLEECKTEVKETRISQIADYINKNYTNIENIEQISESFFISKHHLCRMFKNATGITVIDYLNSVKIKNACAYLKTTNETITKIAYLTGFNSSGYFTNVFKKITGMTPVEYRKSKKD